MGNRTVLRRVSFGKEGQRFANENVGLTPKQEALLLGRIQALECLKMSAEDKKLILDKLVNISGCEALKQKEILGRLLGNKLVTSYEDKINSSWKEIGKALNNPKLQDNIIQKAKPVSGLSQGDVTQKIADKRRRIEKDYAVYVKKAAEDGVLIRSEVNRLYEANLSLFQAAADKGNKVNELPRNQDSMINSQHMKLFLKQKPKELPVKRVITHSSESGTSASASVDGNSRKNSSEESFEDQLKRTAREMAENRNSPKGAKKDLGAKISMRWE